MNALRLVAFGLAAVAILLAAGPGETARAGTHSLTTTFSDGNGANGNFFDVAATGGVALEIDQIDAHITNDAFCGGPGDVEVWTRVGTWVGHTDSTAGWTQAGFFSGVAGAVLTGTPLVLQTPISVPAGETVAIAIVSLCVDYTDGTAVGAVAASDAFLTIYQGAGTFGFGEAITIPRIANVTIHYTPGPPATPPQAFVDYEQKVGDDWVPYTPGPWTNAGVVRAVVACEEGSSPMPAAYDVRYRYFQPQGATTFDPSTYPPCVDSAGNESDMSGFAPVQIMIDRQKPLCSLQPVVINSTQDGSMKPFSATLKRSDNLDPAPVRSYTGFTSSDGGGTVQNVTIAGNQVTGQFQNAKSSLQRTYTLNFAATDQAGNVGTCALKIIVK